MKRLSIWVLTLMLFIVIISIELPALGEHELWNCPECGRTGNTGNYCGSCAHPARWMGKSQVEYVVGDTVFFGHYEQDNNLANGKEEIEWVILAVEESKALLISRYGLDAQPYNENNVDITWEKCTLRTWLNGTFLSKAFTAQEQTGIVLTNVDNSKSQGYSGWGTNGGNNTQDRIFLLSYAEANKYLGVTRGNRSSTKSRVAPTSYAIKQGARIPGSDKTADGRAAGWWWLRSPGNLQNRAAGVYTDGSLNYNYVVNVSGCVRPALWINLESDIF